MSRNALENNIISTDIDDLNDFEALKKVDANEWLISYADVVTALLCFFIIFYAIEKKLQKQTGGVIESNVIPEQLSQQNESFGKFVEIMRSVEDVSIVENEDFLNVYFSNTVFFNKGSYVLTDEGKRLFERVIPNLMKIDADRYRIEVQGYTDTTPIAPKKNRWWNSNMELSILRSLKTYEYLVDRGIEKKMIHVAGYGTHKLIEDSVDARDADRRISLKIFPKEKIRN